MGSIIPTAVLLRLSASPYETFAQRLAFALIGAATLLIVGSFWALSAWHRWPELVGLLNRPQKSLLYSGLVIVFSLLALSTMIAFSLRPDDASPHCGPIPVFWNPPSGAGVFTATVYTQGFGDRVNGKSSWAIVRVERDFSGTPKLPGQFVFLANNVHGFGDTGEEWFIHSRRSFGMLAKHLPVCQIGRCNRTRPLQDAGVDLRVLSDGPPATGVRIIGEAFGDRGGRVVGAKILISGPSGSVETTTDSEGIYDIKGLAAGHYSVHASPSNRKDDRWAQREQRNIKDGEVWGREVYVK